MDKGNICPTQRDKHWHRWLRRAMRAQAVHPSSRFEEIVKAWSKERLSWEMEEEEEEKEEKGFIKPEELTGMF